MIDVMKKAVLFAGAVAISAAGGSAAVEAASYETLSNAKMSLTGAIEAVEEKSGGKVIEAEFDDEDGGTYEISVLTGEKLQEYELNASSGAVREIENEMFEKYLIRLDPERLSSAETSLVEAIAIAEKQVGGKAAEADVDRSGDTVDYEIEVVTADGAAREVTVTADGKCSIVIRRQRAAWKESSVMSLMTIVIILIIVGVLLWLANTYIPMDRKIKMILNIVVVIAVILWLLQAFGLFSGAPAISG